MIETVSMPPKHPWEGPENEEFVPAVELAHMKAALELFRFSATQHAGGGSGLHAIACGQGTPRETAASFRVAMLFVLSHMLEEGKTKLPSNEKLQEQGARFDKYRRGKEVPFDDVLFTVMARIKLRWLKDEEEKFPFDVDEFLTQVEQAK
jgi:hypothetical protein